MNQRTRQNFREKNLYNMEISNLADKGFKILVIGMFTELGMEEWMDHSDNFNKETENIRKHQIEVTEWKNTITELRFMCPTHSETKQYRHVGSLSRERFIAGPHKETGGSCPPNPELPEGFQKSIFKGQVTEGCCWLSQTS